MRTSTLAMSLATLISCVFVAASDDIQARIPPLNAPLPEAAAAMAQDHLGFVVHWGAPGLHDYADSSAQSMLMNLFFWNMRDQSRQLVDFSRAEQWLGYLNSTGMNAAIIIDTSIHHTSIPWRSETTKALGENVRNPTGEQTPYSSPWSPEYRSMVRQYAEDLTAWVRKYDEAGRVTTYVNGAEVFWPGVLDYGPLAREAFRDWLLDRHGSVETVNERWGASFPDADSIEPVAIYRQGHTEFSADGFRVGSWVNGSWSAPVDLSDAPVYRVSAEVAAHDVGPDGAAVILVWTGPEGKSRHDCVGVARCTGGARVRIERDMVPPSWAEGASLFLSLQSAGRVAWQAPTVTALPEGVAALDLSEDRWTFSRWAGTPEGRMESGQGKAARFHIEAAGQPLPCERPHAAWHDFHTFSMEEYAKVMNMWAREVKGLDPDREVMHYLGFLLGTLGQWDDTMLTQRGDIFLSNAPDVDIHGLQLASARGDWHPATAVIDLARKYGKPMVATDLQDFTHGVYIGFNAMNRMSLACAAHGLEGAYYYDWRGTPDYDWHDTWTMQNTRSMLASFRALRQFLAGAELDTRVAFVLPIMPYCDTDPAGLKADMLDAMGWYKLLLAAGVCPDVFTPYELESGAPYRLNDYAAVVVPDCPFLPRRAAGRLWQYVDGGGTLLLNGRPPERDETHAALPRPFSAGAASEGGRVVWNGAYRGRAFLGPVIRTRVAGNTPPMFMPDFQRVNPDDPVRRAEQAALTAEVRNALAEHGALPAAWLTEPDPALECLVYRSAGETRVVLIHRVEGMHNGGSVTFAQPGEGTPRVEADFEGREAEVKDGRAVRLPVFEDSCTIAW